MCGKLVQFLYMQSILLCYKMRLFQFSYIERVVTFKGVCCFTKLSQCHSKSSSHLLVQLLYSFVLTLCLDSSSHVSDDSIHATLKQLHLCLQIVKCCSRRVTTFSVQWLTKQQISRLLKVRQDRRGRSQHSILLEVTQHHEYDWFGSLSMFAWWCTQTKSKCKFKRMIKESDV